MATMPQVTLPIGTPEELKTPQGASTAALGAMKGSAPPLSQQLIYRRDALQDISKSLARIYREAPVGKGTLLGIAWGLGEIEREMTILARELREREEKAATPWQRI